jgi:phosphatidylglycerol:prolipoprotein diacylglycerol transferase
MHLNIDPVIFYAFGYPILRWYSLAYIFGFLSAYFLFKKMNDFTTKEQMESMFNYAFFGVILGGRLGYVVFYNLKYYILHPFEIPAVWQGGMSFHGGLIGVAIGLVWFCKKHNVDVWKVADIAPVCATPGLFFGRIANFINGELWGAKTTLPIGFVFPASGTMELRHPTQLYEATLEGLVVFVITFLLYRKKSSRNGKIFALFLILYGTFRFAIEFVREPDIQIGYIILNTFTMGHLLCFGMVVTGLIFYYKDKLFKTLIKIF